MYRGFFELEGILGRFWRFRSISLCGRRAFWPVFIPIFFDGDSKQGKKVPSLVDDYTINSKE